MELAATDEELDRGLMYRRELPEGRGMLFDFKQDRPVGMWMKNTYISLDMLFIRSDGTIVKIAEKTKPHCWRTSCPGLRCGRCSEVIGGTRPEVRNKARRQGGSPDIPGSLRRRFVVFSAPACLLVDPPSTPPPASFR